MSNQKNVDQVATISMLQLFERIRFLDSGKAPKLSETDKSKIKDMWHKFVQGDNTQTGMTAFLRMFEMFPMTKEKFDFARDSASGQMQSSARVIFHVTRVIKYISMVVDKLDTPEEMVPILKQIGGRHSPKGYNIPEKFFPCLCDSIVDVIQKQVPSFNTQIETAFREMMRWVFEQMVAGQKEYAVK